VSDILRFKQRHGPRAGRSSAGEDPPDRQNGAMQLTEVSPADFPAVIALWDEAGLTRPWNPPAADLQRALDTETSTVLGAVVDDRLVGTVMVGHDGHRGWVYYLAVATTERGTGLGRALMNGAEAWLTARGVVKVQLMVRQTNTAVTGFYERLGYADADVRVLSKRLD
jgi:ribosomal protein S18 acetylase RimI-like enzyme